MDRAYSAVELEEFAERLVPFVVAHPDIIVSMGPRADVNQVEVVMTMPDAVLVADMQTVVPLDVLLVTVRPGERVIGA